MRFVAFVLSLCLLLPASVGLAQTFSPKNYPDCVMLHVKKAQSPDAAMLMRLACKCRFKEQGSPECAKYTPRALDCMIDNLQAVERDTAAWGVERACRTNYPAGN